jgi:hypothetical protein
MSDGCLALSPMELFSRLERTKLSAHDVRALTHEPEFRPITD